MGASDILQVAQGLAAGATITLVGVNGNVVDVTSEGYLNSIDSTVRDLLNNSTYGLSAIYDAINGSGGIDADLSTVLSRLTSVRAGYLDELSAANIPADIDSLLSRLTSIRAGYLDNINNSDLVNITLSNINIEVGTVLNTIIPSSPTAGSINERIKSLDDNFTATRAGYLDELSAANIPADVDTLLTRLTSARAGYLDNINFNLDSRLGTPSGLSIAADIAENQTDLNTLLTNLSTVDSTVSSNSSELLNATYGLSSLNAKISGGSTNGSYSYTVGTTEQTLLEISQTNIYSLVSFWADLSNFTSGRTIIAKVYIKVDGTNYRLIDTMDYVIGTHDAISISPQFNINHNWKITVQIDTAEAGAISIPYRYVLSDFT